MTLTICHPAHCQTDEIGLSAHTALFIRLQHLRGDAAILRRKIAVFSAINDHRRRRSLDIFHCV